jgi:uncharacterized membrane protein YhaH (DUF805 family)
MNWYIAVLKKYAVFTGRAGRSEYWIFTACSLGISVVLAIFDWVAGITNQGNPFGINTLYVLAVFVPSLAVTVRRLHDTGRSGWWLLIALIPLVGAIVLIVFLAQESQPGDNQHGPNPYGQKTQTS